MLGTHEIMVKTVSFLPRQRQTSVPGSEVIQDSSLISTTTYPHNGSRPVLPSNIGHSNPIVYLAFSLTGRTAIGPGHPSNRSRSMSERNSPFVGGKFSDTALQVAGWVVMNNSSGI